MTGRTVTAAWVEGVPADDATDLGGLGGDPSNPTWEEFVLGWKPEWRGHLEAIREAHQVEGMDLYGEDMNEGYWKLSDGAVFSCSWRAWGDCRQAIENKREGYMRYYMRRV